jgi:hypothetical protein
MGLTLLLNHSPVYRKQGWWAILFHWIILQFTESNGDGPDSFTKSFSILQKASVMGLTLSFNHSSVHRKQGWWAWLFHWVILQFTESHGDGPDSFTETFSSLQKAMVMGLTLSLRHSPVYRKPWWWAWLFHWDILQFTESKGHGPDSFIESFSNLQNTRVMGLKLSLNHSPVYRKQAWWVWLFHWIILQLTESNGDGPPLGLMFLTSHSFYVNSTSEIPPALSAGVIFQFSMV